MVILNEDRRIYLGLAEDEGLQFALEIVDAKLDGRFARIQSDFELGTLTQVADADDVPGHLRRFLRAERADERKLLR